MAGHRDLIRMVETLQQQVEEHRRLIRNMVRFATVDKVDAEKGTLIAKDDDGLETPDDTPWLEAAAGGSKELQTHNPPAKGDRVLLLCLDGDPANCLAIKGLFHEDRPRPSKKGDEQVVKIGDLTVTKRGDRYFSKLGNVEVEQTKDMVRGRVNEDARFVAVPGGSKIRKGGSWVVVDGTDVIVSKLPKVGSDPLPG